MAKKYIDAEKLKEDIQANLAAISFNDDYQEGYEACGMSVLKSIESLQQDQPEISLEKFTEKLDDWKARYNYPDNISIKATMAFTARMFYQYPNAARQWYDSLPKATMD